MAGVTGFSEGLVRNRFHRATGGTKGGHGLYFDPEFVKQKWKPFLIDEQTPVDGDGEQGEHLPRLAKLLYHGWARFICKIALLIVWILVAVLVIGAARWLISQVPWSTAAREGERVATAKGEGRPDGLAGPMPGQDSVDAESAAQASATTNWIDTGEPPPDPPVDIPDVSAFDVPRLTEEQRNSAYYKKSKLVIRNETDAQILVGLTFEPKNPDEVSRSKYRHIVPEPVGGHDQIEVLQHNFGGPYHVSIHDSRGWQPTHTWFDLGIVPSRTIIVTNGNPRVTIILSSE
jgi:hypothetical protein